MRDVGTHHLPSCSRKILGRRQAAGWPGRARQYVLFSLAGAGVGPVSSCFKQHQTPGTALDIIYFPPRAAYQARLKISPASLLILVNYAIYCFRRKKHKII